MSQVVLPPIVRKTPISFTLIRNVLRFLPQSVKVFMYKLAARACYRLGYGLLHDTVVRLPFGMVLKRASRAEADALRFVATLDGINAPIVIDFAVYCQSAYLLTNFIAGDCACDVWDLLTADDQARLVADLRAQLSAMRAQTASADRPICNASGGVIKDPRISWLADPEENPRRVLTSSQEFLGEVWRGIEWPHNRERLLPLIKPVIDHGATPIVFCHGDLKTSNLVFPGGLARWRAGRSRICLLDWEFAGWMPHPWEALKATFLCIFEDDDWMPLVRQIFPDAAVHLDVDWQWRLHSNVTLI